MSLLYIAPAILWERMLKRITVTPSGCWRLAGAVNSKGYTCVASGRKGKTALGHHVAVIVSGRQIPEGMTVDHLCHDASRCAGGRDCPHRRCVNPAHLGVVTRSANAERAHAERRLHFVTERSA